MVRAVSSLMPSGLGLIGDVCLLPQSLHFSIYVCVSLSVSLVFNKLKVLSQRITSCKRQTIIPLWAVCRSTCLAVCVCECHQSWPGLRVGIRSLRVFGLGLSSDAMPLMHLNWNLLPNYGHSFCGELSM